MSPEAQRITIAEVCGYRDIAHRVICEGTGLDTWVWSSGIIGMGGRELPDYLNDLNAMYKAEKVLTFEQQTDYMHILATTDTLSVPPTQFTLNEGWYLTHATAAQRAEAFLKILNLWKE